MACGGASSCALLCGLAQIWCGRYICFIHSIMTLGMNNKNLRAFSASNQSCMLFVMIISFIDSMLTICPTTYNPIPVLIHVHNRSSTSTSRTNSATTMHNDNKWSLSRKKKVAKSSMLVISPILHSSIEKKPSRHPRINSPPFKNSTIRCFKHPTCRCLLLFRSKLATQCNA